MKPQLHFCGFLFKTIAFVLTIIAVTAVQESFAQIDKNGLTEIFDGRKQDKSKQISKTEINLVEKEVSANAKRIKKLIENENYKCVEDDFGVSGVAEGSYYAPELFAKSISL